MAPRKQINDQLLKLLKQTREDRMKLMGVDITKLRALEKDAAKKFNKLQKEMQKIYKKSGEDVAKRHRASQTRAQRIIHNDIESILSARQQHPDLWIQRYTCTCYFPYTAEYENSGEEIDLTPSSGSNSSGSVIFDDGIQRAHPIADASGQADGGFSHAQVKAWFTFSFTPESNGTYCILPVVHLNGYWMLWMTSGCEDFDLLPVFELVARVRVRVDQLSSTVRSQSYDVLPGPNYSTLSSGFDYDSDVNQEILMEVPLTGGDQAIVFVECELLAGVSHVGHATVDLQSSPHFYFEVPMVRWGRPCDRLLPINWP